MTETVSTTLYGRLTSCIKHGQNVFPFLAVLRPNNKSIFFFFQKLSIGDLFELIY